MNCAQVKILGIPFRGQRALGAHLSPLGVGVLSSSFSVAPPSSQTSPTLNGCVVQGPIGMPMQPIKTETINRGSNQAINVFLKNNNGGIP